MVLSTVSNQLLPVGPVEPDPSGGGPDPDPSGGPADPDPSGGGPDPDPSGGCPREHAIRIINKHLHIM